MPVLSGFSTKYKVRSKMDKIINIAIDKLEDFPRQAEIYGAADIDAEFVASVMDRGILTPLTVTPLSKEKFQIISGHRRKKGAIAAGLNDVPCIVKNYENEEEKELDFLIFNLQREKEKSVRLKEFLHYKQILCQIGKVRKSKGIYDNTVFENDQFYRILKTLKLDDKIDGKPLNSMDILKEITGYTRYEQEYLNVLYSPDWLQKELEKLRTMGVSRAHEDNIIEQMEVARNHYESEKVTLNDSVKQIKGMFEQAAKSLSTKKEKKAGKLNKNNVEAIRKASEDKEKMKFDNIKKRELIKEVHMPEEWSQLPIKYGDENSILDFKFKIENCDFGIVKTNGHITAFTVRIDRSNYVIDSLKLLELCKKSIGGDDGI